MAEELACCLREAGANVDESRVTLRLTPACSASLSRSILSGDWRGSDCPTLSRGDALRHVFIGAKPTINKLDPNKTKRDQMRNLMSLGDFFMALFTLSGHYSVGHAG